MCKKKITYLVFRNTSTLDYSIPYICSLKKQNPEYDITVLYCVFNRKHIVRNAKYYDNIFAKYNIKQADFGDLCDIKYIFVKRWLKKLFSISPNDVIGIKSFIKRPFFINGISIYYILHRYKNKIQNYIMNKHLNISKILEFLDPDLILFDHRGKNKIYFPKENLLLDFIHKKGIKVVLIPHANHQLGETDEYEPFGIGEDSFPKFCDHWSSSNFVKPYLMVDFNQRNQFAQIGYPGTDSKWIDNNIRKQKTEISILIITRRITAKYYPGTAADDIIVSYDRFIVYMNKIYEQLNKLEINYKLVIKPHPSSSYPEMVRALEETGIKNYTISYEPFFESLSYVDLVITEFTTSIGFPVLYKIPTILIYTPLLDSIFSQWNILKDLYENMKYYTKDINNLSATVKDALADNKYLDDEYNHFRNFYEDGAINRAIDRTIKLLKVEEDKC